jgi:hypothetical protein
VGDQLLDVERVALRARRDAPGHRHVGRAQQDRLDLLADLGLGERAERDRLNRRAALELGDVALERLQVPAVVQPVRRDEQDPLAVRIARHERQEVERRGVGPVDVLDDQHHRRLVGQAREQLEQVLVLTSLRAA